MVIEEYNIDGVQISIHDDFLPKTKEEEDRRYNELDDLVNRILKNKGIRNMNLSL